MPLSVVASGKQSETLSESGMYCLWEKEQSGMGFLVHAASGKRQTRAASTAGEAKGSGKYHL